MHDRANEARRDLTLLWLNVYLAVGMSRDYYTRPAGGVFHRRSPSSKARYMSRFISGVIYLLQLNLLWRERTLFFVLGIFALCVQHNLLWVAFARRCQETAPCGLRGCKNRPAPFPGRMSLKATKPGSRKTPLRTPLRGGKLSSRRRAFIIFGLMYCFIVCCVIVLSPALNKYIGTI